MLETYVAGLSLLTTVFFEAIAVSTKAIIETSENFEDTASDVLSYQIHEVKDGENLSIIFEDFKVPLNTAYRIFRLDEKKLLSKIRPGDKMRFIYRGEEITSIEIAKDPINSLLIDLNSGISIKEINYIQSYPLL